VKQKTRPEAGLEMRGLHRCLSTGNKPVIHHHSKINDLRAKWARLLA